MTQEDKELLLIDLCARLPYDVCVHIRYNTGEPCYGKLTLQDIQWFIDSKIVTIKPYLRPMSSMTEEERKGFSVFIGKTETYVQQICLDADSMVNPVIGGYQCVYWGLFDKCIDWLLERHFDYRGLIPMGLALEAPEGMYKFD